MASEKVTAMIEEIKAMSVLELLPPRRRPSLTSF